MHAPTFAGPERPFFFVSLRVELAKLPGFVTRFHLVDVVICDSNGVPVPIGPKSNPLSLVDLRGRSKSQRAIAAYRLHYS